MNGVSAPGDAALSGDKKSSGRMSFFHICIIKGKYKKHESTKKKLLEWGFTKNSTYTLYHI